MTDRAIASRYLEWAKLHSRAKFNLATSGIASYPLAALPLALTDLEINGPDSYGYEPLKNRLAQKCGVTPEQVFTTNGASMANHLAMAAILAPGDDVLIEQPTYGLLLEVASYLSANILRFQRRPENAWQIDPDEVRNKITPKTRLIVLTNMHNPSGAFTSQTTLAQLGQITSEIGAKVLVDEVYLDTAGDLDPQQQAATRSSIHLGDQFVVTTSLTKAYGLSGLRCGWILAEPGLTKRIWRLNDLFNATPSHPSELLSVMTLDNLDQIASRTRQLLQVNRQALNAFLDSRSDLEVVRPLGGTVVFPKLKYGPGAQDAGEFCQLLRTEFETAVVPGEFFEMPSHFRIGIGGDPAMTSQALDRLSTALDHYQTR